MLFNWKQWQVPGTLSRGTYVAQAVGQMQNSNPRVYKINFALHVTGK